MPGERVFSAYVLIDSPTADDVEAILPRLAGFLRDGMRHRRVSSVEPRDWGYAGRSWNEKATFNDLLNDCFAYVFWGNEGRRLFMLRQYARQQDSIDPVVRLAIKNFLNEKETEKNPIGHVVFKNIQAAVSGAIDEGEIKVSGGPRTRLRSDTLVEPEGGKKASRLSLADLRVELGGWPDGNSLCVCMSKRSPKGVRAAAETVSRLLLHSPARGKSETSSMLFAMRYRGVRRRLIRFWMSAILTVM